MTTSSITRRQAIALGAGVLAAPLLPHSSRGQTVAWRDLPEVRDLVGSGELVNSSVTLDLPDIWEDGSAVSLGAVVNLPTSGPDRVADLTIFAPGNPAKEVARYHFTPHSGRAEIATRIRINQTQPIVAIARTAAGALHYAEKEVRVTVSGCIGVAAPPVGDDLMLTRVRGPDRFVRGVPGMITTLINHPQQNGGHIGANGQPLPVNLVTGLTASLGGTTLFSAEFNRGVTANPYLRFFVMPSAEGEIILAWTEDTGRTAIAFLPVRF